MLKIDDVKYLEGLMRLSLSDEEREVYAKEMSDILDYVQNIESVEIDGETKPLNINAYREDVVKVAEEHKTKMLENVPDKLGDLVKVSQVIK
jgi:aspartyl-tRNA(Asn)/glutamyl-tRNA(Gln) amidotransferase subunit C